MRVAFSVSRGIRNYQFILDAVQESGYEITFIIHGDYPGEGESDQLVERYALEFGFDQRDEVLRIPANWKKYGLGAGHKRNRPMIRISEACIILWDGKSKGAGGFLEYCKKIGKPYYLKLV